MATPPAPEEDLLAELRELGSIDLDAVDVPDGPRLRRPVLDDVDAVERELDTVVIVTVSHGGRRVVGSSRCGHASGCVDRASAQATLDALEQLIPPGRVEWHVDRAELLGPATPHRPAVLHASIAVRSAHGEELVVGSAVVRSTTHEAASRATLDALNRRLATLIDPV